MTEELAERLISAIESLKVIVGIELFLAIVCGCVLGLGALAIIAEWRKH